MLRIVRRAPSNADEVFWNPDTGEFDPAMLAGVDAVVNLAGVGIGDRRWTAAHRREVLASRVDSTGSTGPRGMSPETGTRGSIASAARGARLGSGPMRGVEQAARRMTAASGK